MTWNYRVGTQIFSYKNTFKGKNKELANHPDTQLFSIIVVYYDKVGNIIAYSNHNNPLKDLESMEDLKRTYTLINEAFNKPVIDLDNFPNEWDTKSF